MGPFRSEPGFIIKVLIFLSDNEMNSLWTPYIIYTNTADNEATKVKHKFKDIKTTMAVLREGNFTRSSLETVDEVEIFQAMIYES